MRTKCGGPHVAAAGKHNCKLLQKLPVDCKIQSVMKTTIAYWRQLVIDIQKQKRGSDNRKQKLNQRFIRAGG